jgi:hypothetical protein
MLAYETLLDLARQRLDTIARSPNFTRGARHHALDLRRTVEAELAALNAGHPSMALVPLAEANECRRARNAVIALDKAA